MENVITFFPCSRSNERCIFHNLRIVTHNFVCFSFIICPSSFGSRKHILLKLSLSSVSHLHWTLTTSEQIYLLCMAGFLSASFHHCVAFNGHSMMSCTYCGCDSVRVSSSPNDNDNVDTSQRQRNVELYDDNNHRNVCHTQTHTYITHISRHLSHSIVQIRGTK